MDVQWWLNESFSRIRTNGLDGLRWSTRKVYHKLLQFYSRIGHSGQSIYEKDWDVLIVLDACRLDLMRDVAPEFGYDRVEGMESVATMTKKWMEKNFSTATTEEVANTIYVCSNPYSDSELTASQFARLDEVWQYAWDQTNGTVQPRPVTDRAISAGRTRDDERMIVHYMQPHYPFVGAESGSLPSSGGQIEVGSMDVDDSADVWTRLRKGEVSADAVWSAYRANLECVMHEVDLLLNNLDSDDVVITSDHGNAFGEWGVYGHPMEMPVPAIRRVPWIRTRSTDEWTHTPDEYDATDEETNVNQRLTDLGYLEE